MGQGHLRSSLFAPLGFPHLRIRIRFAQGAVEPAVEVVAERAGAQHAEAVFLPQTVNLNYNVTHGRGERGEWRVKKGAGISNWRDQSEERVIRRRGDDISDGREKRE